ncbi:MAG: hypothetical protein KAI83_11570 [Thiomargarita sp.]|nr:hypothetical protein [Thiomargarita sp.]
MYDTAEIEKLIKELHFDLQEAWIAELLDLVIQKYPSLDMYGSKENLKRDIKQIIENVVNKKELNP